MKISLRNTSFFALLSVACSIYSVSAQEMTADQVIARHRAAIASKEKLTNVKNQMVLGDAKFTFKGSATVLNGKVLILSEGDKNLWGMTFNSIEYPQDRYAFDGKEVKIGRPNPSARSLLGEFLYNNRVLLKDGLMGGVLSSSWALLDDAPRAKITYDGRKVVNGQSTHVLEYSPKGGSGATIKMYFDEKTLHHVRTEYTVVQAASQGATIDSSASRTAIIHRVTEDFSDFMKAGDLVLPKTYKITFARSGSASLATSNTANRDAEWEFTVTNVNFNQALEANSFNIDG